MSLQYLSQIMLGPFTALSNTPLNRDTHKKIVRILHTLLQKPESMPFRKPVAHKALKLENYRNIIKKPMDLNLIRRQNNQNLYRTVEQILDDIQLCWDNCKRYNAPDSEIYQHALHLQQQFIKMVKESFQIPIPDLEIHQSKMTQRQHINNENLIVEDSENKQGASLEAQGNINEEIDNKSNSESMKQQKNAQDQMKEQQQMIPSPDPIPVNINLKPTKQQILQLSKQMKDAQKSTLQQILDILYNSQKQLLQFDSNGSMNFSMTMIHLSTYYKICKLLKLEQGAILIQ